MSPDFLIPPPKANNKILFFTEDVSFELEKEILLKEWLINLINRREAILHSLNFIFCSDDYLYNLNIKYLKHDTLTDVITFHYSSLPVIHGDIYISIERVKENAEKFNFPFFTELTRVMAHGLFHLCGFGDKTKEDAKKMKKKENEAIQILDEMSIKKYE